MCPDLAKLAASLFLMLLTACTHSGRSATATPQYLFVQTAGSGAIDGDRLTLHGVGAQTIYFSDRPRRVTGHLSVTEFVDLWSRGPQSFRDEAPNASLAFVADGIGSVAVFELRDPGLEGASLSFRVRILEGSPPRNFTNPTLFIDGNPQITFFK